MAASARMTAAQAGAGERMQHAVSGILRWSTRPEVRRALRGDTVGSLSPTETWLIDHLAQLGPQRMSELAAWQGVDRSTITAQVGRLEARGLVVRSHDGHDRRSVIVEVSADGHELLARTNARAGQAYERLIAHWPERDRTRFVTLLERLAGELDAR